MKLRSVQDLVSLRKVLVVMLSMVGIHEVR